MKLLDIAPYEPETVGFFDFLILGSPFAFIALVGAAIAVAAVAVVLIVKAIKKKK